MTASDPAAPLIPLVETPGDPLARELFAKLAAGRGILNLHRMMAHAPPLMKASGDMALVFRNDAVLARSLAEIVVLRTAQVIDCDYVWARHIPLAHAAGVSDAKIAEIGNWRESTAFTPAERAALAFAEPAAVLKPVGAATFADLRRELSQREIVELTMLIAFYVSTAIFIKALALPDEKA